MSTKLHYGFMLAEGTDPFEFADRVRTAAGPVRARLDAKLLADDAARIVDMARAGLTQGDADGPAALGRSAAAMPSSKRQRETLSSLSIAKLNFMDEQGAMRRDGRTGQLGYDPNSLSVGLGRDAKTGRILGYPFADRNELREVVLGLDGVIEYGYWNNVDRPDDVTDEEWDERCQAWARVLPGAGVPAESMLTFNLHTAGHIDFDLTARDRWTGAGRIHPLVRETLPSPEVRGWTILTEIAYRRRPEQEGQSSLKAWDDWLEIRRAAKPLRHEAGQALGELSDEVLLAPVSTLAADPQMVGTLNAIVERAGTSRRAS